MGGRLGEIILILILLLLFFGPNKLPDMAKAIGKALNEFKKAVTPSPENQNPPPQQEQAALPPALSSAKKTRKAPAKGRSKARR